MATLPTGGNLRLPEGVRERTDLFANHRFIEKTVARVGGPDEVKQALRSAASGGNPFLEACRIAMFRWSKCQDKREFQPGSLKTKVEIDGFRLKAFSSTKQRQ